MLAAPAMDWLSLRRPGAATVILTLDAKVSFTGLTVSKRTGIRCADLDVATESMVKVLLFALWDAPVMTAVPPLCADVKTEDESVIVWLVIDPDVPTTVVRDNPSSLTTTSAGCAVAELTPYCL